MFGLASHVLDSFPALCFSLAFLKELSDLCCEILVGWDVNFQGVVEYFFQTRCGFLKTNTGIAIFFPRLVTAGEETRRQICLAPARFHVCVAIYIFSV